MSLKLNKETLTILNDVKDINAAGSNACTTGCTARCTRHCSEHCSEHCGSSRC